jgi:membrane fusion protein, multidrug efflux system
MKQYILLTAAAIVLASCGNQSGDKKAQLEKLKTEYKSMGEQIKKLEAEVVDNKTEDATTLKQIQLTEVSTSTFNHYVETQGNVEAKDNVWVGTKMPGSTITKVLVHEGQQVKAGQVLAEGDATATQNQLAAAEINLANGKVLFHKVENLWKQNIGTEVNYLDAKSKVESGEKGVEALRAQIQYSKIIAPFNGVVDEVKIKEGEMVSQFAPGIKVVNMSSMKIKSKMADTYINKIKQGNKVLITIPDLNKEIAAAVTFTGNSVDAISRTFNVEVAIASSELKPNMLINMKINDASISKAIVINQNLVQTSEAGKFVMVAEKNGNKMIAKRVIVKTGDSYNGNIVITNGLNNGDQLISTGYQDLIDGQEVKL